MKKLLFLLTLMLGTIILTGCNKTEENMNTQGEEKDYTEAIQICEEKGGLVFYDELENESPMCYFLEAEGCSLASIERGDCVFLNDESYWENEEEDLGGGERITLVTEICNEGGGIVEYRNNGDGICRFNEHERCFLNDVAVGACHSLGNTPMCPEIWMPVCGKDGKTYSNRCFLEAAGIQEDTEAEVTNRGCIFG